MWLFSIPKAIAFLEHLYIRYVPCSPFFLWCSYPNISGPNVLLYLFQGYLLADLIEFFYF